MVGACFVALPAFAGEAPLPGEPPRVGARPAGTAGRRSSRARYRPGFGAASAAAGQTVSWRGVLSVVDVTMMRAADFLGAAASPSTGGGALDIGLKALACDDRQIADRGNAARLIGAAPPLFFFSCWARRASGGPQPPCAGI